MFFALRGTRWRGHAARGAFVVSSFLLAFGVTADVSTVTAENSSVTLVDGASGALVFTLTRSGDTSYSDIMNYATQDGTAMAGVDYAAVSGGIAIPAGSSSVTVSVPIIGENLPATKSFSLNLSSIAGIGASPTFSTQTTFATDTQPVGVAVADINNDGLPDAVTVNVIGNTISVLLNTTAPGTTTPSYAAQQTFAAGNTPMSVAIADINGDGKPDVIVSNSRDNTISVLLNTTTPGSATASFAAQQTFATGDSPSSVVIADVNGDGKPDVIVANSGNGAEPGTVSVLLNTTAPGAGSASFAGQKAFYAGNVPQAVRAGDVNGDGKVDLVVVGPNGVSVLLNSTAAGASTASFLPASAFAAGTGIIAMAMVDINGDGKPDLLLAVVSTTSDITILLNTTVPGATTPSFSAAQTFSNGGNASSIEAVDTNGDGKLDLVVVNQQDSSVSVLTNTTPAGAAKLSFAAALNFQAGSAPRMTVAADVNGDGAPDILVASPSTNDLVVLLNTTPSPAASPNFTAPTQIGAAPIPFAVAIADFNGDGLPDLASAGIGAVSVSLNATPVGAANPSLGSPASFPIGSGFAMVAADFNGDGKPDLAVSDFKNNDIVVLINTTSAGASTPSFASTTLAVGNTVTGIAAADLNGDGMPDLVLSNSGNNTVSVLLNSTSPGASIPSFQPVVNLSPGANVYATAIADFNGDGKPDLAVSLNSGMPSSAGGNVAILLNTTAAGATAASFAAPIVLPVAASYPRAIAAADFNGDGRPDLAIGGADGTTVAVMFNTTAAGATTASFSAASNLTTISFPEALAVADVNGDGKPDLIAVGNPDVVSIFVNQTAPGSSTAVFASRSVVANGSDDSRGLAVADLNGDGKPDLVVADSANTSTSVSVLLNSQYFARASVAGATGTIQYQAPVVGVSPATLSFGSQPIAYASQSQAITLSNTGNSALLISSISATGDFAQTGTCSSSLAAGASCAINVSFTPTAIGSRSGAISIVTNAAGSPTSISLAGTGISDIYSIGVNPASIAFGSQMVGTTVAGQSVTVTNTGNVPITPSAAVVSGANAGDFALVSNTCTGSLSPGGACAMSFSFTPGATGNRGATGTIGTSQSGVFATVALSGTGTAPQPSLSPTSLSFGSQLEGSTSTTQQVTLSNLGTAALTITSIAAAGDFAESNNCPGSLPVSGNCVITVSFSPTAAGSRSGSLAVVSNAASSPSVATLSGTGVAPAPTVSLSPATLTFAGQTVGATSAAQTVTLNNTGTAALVIASIAASGDYAETNNCPASLAVGSSCTISVAFTPTQAGTRSGTLLVTSNAASSPDGVALTGSGTAPPSSPSGGGGGSFGLVPLAFLGFAAWRRRHGRRQCLGAK